MMGIGTLHGRMKLACSVCIYVCAYRGLYVHLF